MVQRSAALLVALASGHAGIRHRADLPFFAAVPSAARYSLISDPSIVIPAGAYRLAPLSSRLDDGGYRASVSIRSGSGSASTDRIVRFLPRFDSAGDAHRYAHAQGLLWVSRSSTPFVADRPR